MPQPPDAAITVCERVDQFQLIMVKAADLTAYTPAEDPAKPDDETKKDEQKKDESKTDDTKKEETKKDDTSKKDTTPAPSTPTKANVDCEEAMRVGNEYAISLGFEIWDGCRSYRPPCYFEEDFLSSQWNQETFNAAMKGKVDSVKAVLESTSGGFIPDQPGVDGEASDVWCYAFWNAAKGYHEMYVYFA